MKRMEGKVVMVTGGASGIGRATCLRLAEEGASVVVCDLDAERGGKTAAECGAEFHRLDVSAEADWQRVVGDVEAKHGHIDALVNNAGILLSGPLEDTSVEDFDRVFAVNARGPFLGCKHLLPALVRAGGGAIVNVSSITSFSGSAKHVVYGASKGAVRALTAGVAAHCRDANNGVRCNSVHPGGVNTPLLREEANVPPDVDPDVFGNAARASGAQMCEPRDVASTIAFLCSDDARAINGAAMVVDEAYTI